MATTEHVAPSPDALSGGQIEFRYGVLRVWEILAGGPGIWPLLPLVGHSEPKRLRRIIHQLEPRVERQVSAEEAGVFWTSMYLLAGLRFDKQFAKVLLSGVRQMKESTTYQAILEEGAKEIALRILRTLGTRRFGKPSAKVSRKLQTCEVGELERMIERVDAAASWDALIGENHD